MATQSSSSLKTVVSAAVSPLTTTTSMISSPLLSSMREDYRLSTLEENIVSHNPFKQFDKWFQDEMTWKSVKEPNAMHLSTCTKDGKPSGRIVLLKYFDQHGFVFFTNYNSRKSKEMIENPFAAITFFWNQRQVRIEGSVEKVTREESENYFKTRPKASQVGAWVSEFQSSEVTKDQLVESQRRLEKQYECKEVPTPEFWGGWRIKPTCFEFWQGKGGRIHDRIKYKLINPQKQQHCSNGNSDHNDCSDGTNGNNNASGAHSPPTETKAETVTTTTIISNFENNLKMESTTTTSQTTDEDDDALYGKWSIKRLYP